MLQPIYWSSLLIPFILALLYATLGRIRSWPTSVWVWSAIFPLSLMAAPLVWLFIDLIATNRYNTFSFIFYTVCTLFYLSILIGAGLVVTNALTLPGSNKPLFFVLVGILLVPSLLVVTNSEERSKVWTAWDMNIHSDLSLVPERIDGSRKVHFRITNKVAPETQRGQWVKSPQTREDILLDDHPGYWNHTSTEGETLKVYRAGKEDCLTPSGRILWNWRFEVVESCPYLWELGRLNAGTVVGTQGKHGLIRADGKWIIPMSYEFLEPDRSGNVFPPKLYRFRVRGANTQAGTEERVGCSSKFGLWSLSTMSPVIGEELADCTERRPSWSISNEVALVFSTATQPTKVVAFANLDRIGGVFRPLDTPNIKFMSDNLVNVPGPLLKLTRRVSIDDVLRLEIDGRADFDELRVFGYLWWVRINSDWWPVVLGKDLHWHKMSKKDFPLLPDNWMSFQVSDGILTMSPKPPETKGNASLLARIRDGLLEY